MTKIFSARAIITMNPGQPRATHIAVRDGRILAVGRKENISSWEASFGPCELDPQFHDKVILPGFVEGHAHLFEGMLWDHIYVGFYDRQGPDGTIWPGLKSIEDVVARLQQIRAQDPLSTKPLVAWGFDPIFFGERRLKAADLDQVATDCPVLVFHASLHIVNTNQYIIDKAGVDASDNSEFLRRDDHGKLTGEFLGQMGMFLAARSSGMDLFASANAEHVIHNFAAVGRRAGVTTTTDLANSLSDDAVSTLSRVTRQPDFPMRLVVAHSANGIEADQGIARLAEVADQQNEKLVMNSIKLVADGSIQGFSARLRWPYYHNGAPNGLWYIDPDRLTQLIDSYHRAGIQIHVHTNGDAATDAALDAFEAALGNHYRADHRHMLQHCQMADRAQFRRMKALGVGVNLFSNHIFYWGDQHLNMTMGPDRAHRLDNAGCALREGVAMTIHSDAPVTALAPLFTAWCAVNRLTSSGHTLGGDVEKISIDEALEAITLGAAYSLKMDHLIGSLEIGKYADFAVLDHDPTDIEPETLKDIHVHATVVGGMAFVNETIASA